VKSLAVNRREIEAQLDAALKEWLAKHPRPDEAQQALFEALFEALRRDVRGRQPDDATGKEASA